jgi:hypothetical protein
VDCPLERAEDRALFGLWHRRSPEATRELLVAQRSP